MDKNIIKEHVLNFAKKAAKVISVTAAIAAISLAAVKIYRDTDKKNFTIQARIVSEHYAEQSSFLGYNFTEDLVEAIHNKDIDLYDVYIGNYPYSDAKGGVFIVDGKKSVPGTADRLKVVDSTYVQYTEEYIEKYYAPGCRPASDGYWEYTIDIVE